MSNKVYFYKLTVDDGGAPCVERGLLSLAICKPMVRSTAEPGDLIVGFAAKSLYKDNRLLYVARVTEKLRDGNYYVAKQFRRRSDCIYERRGDRFIWRRGAKYHSSANVPNDLGKYPKYERSTVLLSHDGDFHYLGRDGTSEYKARYPELARAVERLGQGHRVRHAATVREQLLRLAADLRARNPPLGTPTTAPKPNASHRGRSCAVL